jgi:hypothetical protein
VKPVLEWALSLTNGMETEGASSVKSLPDSIKSAKLFIILTYNAQFREVCASRVPAALHD